MLERFINLIEKHDGRQPIAFERTYDMRTLPIEAIRKWHPRAKIVQYATCFHVSTTLFDLRVTQYTIYLTYRNKVPYKVLNYVLALLGYYDQLNQLYQAWDRPIQQNVTYYKYFSTYCPRN